MKLHLPNRLRKSLLACLAAVASLLPATLSSGAAFSAVFCTFALADEVSLIAEDEEDDEEYGIMPYAASGFQGPSIDWSDTNADVEQKVIADHSSNQDISLTTDKSAINVTQFKGWKYTFSGGRDDLDVRLYKTVFGGGAELAGTLTAHDLFLTSSTPNNNNNFYKITTSSENYLANINGTIYIQTTGLLIQGAQTSGISANFSIGASSLTGSASSVSALQIAANVTTSGYLQVQEDTAIDIQNATLTVSALKGSGDLTLNTLSAANGGNAAAGTLAITGDSSSYGGQLTFNGTATAGFTIQLGASGSEETTLSATGLSGSYGAVTAASGASAKLVISGTNTTANSVSNIRIGSNVTLELGAGAYQKLSAFTFDSGASLTMGAGSTLALSGGVLDVSGGSFTIHGEGKVTLDLDLVSAETVLKWGSHFNATMLGKLNLNLLTDLELGESYNLFDISGSTLDGWDWQEALQAMLLDGEDYVFAESGGYITISLAAELSELSWATSAGSGVWAAGQTGGWGEAYPQTANVTFGAEGDSAEGSAVEVTLQGSVAALHMTVAGGKWTFDSGSAAGNTLNVSNALIIGSDNGAAAVTFEGAGDVSASEMTVKTNSSATFSNTGSKSLGTVVLETGSTLTITSATGWTSTTISGEGSLVFQGFSGLSQAELTSLFAILPSTAQQLQSLHFDHVQLQFNDDSNHFAAALCSAREVYIENGASIGFHNGSFNNGTSGLLHLSGSGANEEGALYISDESARTCKWDIQLEGEGATLASASRLELKGQFNGNGKTLTKKGAGALSLYDTFTTAENSSGSFSLVGSALTLEYGAKGGSEQLANYSVYLDGSSALGLVSWTVGSDDSAQTLNDYTIRYLAGDEGSNVAVYARSNSNNAATTTGTGTLTIKNTYSEAQGAYRGSSASNLSIVVAENSYWAIGNGVALAGALEVAGTVEYIHSSGNAGSLATLTGTGTLKVNGGELNVAASSEYHGSVVLSAGGTLSLNGGGTQQLASISVAAGQTGNLGLNAASRGVLSIGVGSLSGIEGSLHILLQGLTVGNISSFETYQLFADWDSIRETVIGLINGGQLTIETAHIGRSTVSFNTDNGYVELETEASKTLVWTNDGGDSIWRASTDGSGSPNWDDESGSDEVFFDYDSVIFNSAGNVTISGSVVAADMTVNGSLSLTGGELGISGALHLGDGAALSLAEVTLTSDLTVTATGESGASLTGSLKEGSALSLTAGSRLTLDAANGASFAGSLAMAHNATLILASDLTITNWSGTGSTEAAQVNFDATEDGHTLILHAAQNKAGITSRLDTSFTFGEHLELRKTGAGEFRFVSGDNTESVGTGMVTVNGRLVVAEGSLRFNGGAELNGDVVIEANASLYFWKNSTRTRTINGALSGAGTLLTINQQLDINGGGQMTGVLQVDYAGIIGLGDDLTVGGLKKTTGGNPTIRKSSAAAADQDVTLTVNVVSGASSTMDGAAIGAGVVIKKTGAGTQALTNATVNGSIEVVEGTLNISPSTSGAAVTIGQNLTLHAGGTLNWGTGHLTVAGEANLATGVSLSVAAGQSLRFGSLAEARSGGASISVASGGSMNIGNANGGSLTSLALNGSLALGGGTLNIGSLSVASGASLSISLTGAVKLAVGEASGAGATLHLNVDDVKAFLQDGELEYTLFDASGIDWTDIFSSVVIDDYDLGKITVEIQGNKLVFTNNIGNLVWNNNDSDVWQNDTAGWNNDTISDGTAMFGDGDNVTFNDSSAHTVTISGEIEANRLTVVDGDWTFADHPEDDAPDSADSLSITSGVAIQSGSATFELSSLSIRGEISGAVNIAGGEAALTGAAFGAATSTITAESTSWAGTLAVGTDAGQDAQANPVKVATVTFAGGEVTGEGLSIAGGSTVTVSSAGSKNFGSVSVGEGSRLVITNAGAEGWGGTASSSQLSVVSGEGALVFSGVSASGDKSKGLIYNLLKTGAGTSLAKLVLQDGADFNLNSEFGSANSGSNSFATVRELHVESGSSLGLHSGTMNGGNTSLHLSGEGVTVEATGEAASYKKGALYISGEGRTMTWNITLDANAMVRIEGASQGRINYTGTLDGKGHTFTKAGTGDLVFQTDFNTAASSTGAIKVEAGLLELRYTSQVNALAAYDVNLSGATAVLGQSSASNLKIRALAGVAGSAVSSYNGSGSVSDSTARTLVISNTETAAGDANTFFGTVSQGVTIVVEGGYEKLAGSFATGAHFSVSGSAAQSASLALAGEFGGAHTLTVGDYGTLDLTGATRVDAARLTIKATGTHGTISGLSLQAGDVLGFANEAQADGSDALVSVQLSNATLAGGSELQFGVRKDTDGWVTATQFVVADSLNVTATAENKIRLTLNPYGRTDDGDVVTLKAGTKHLLIAGSNLSADLVDLLEQPHLAGRLKYKLAVETAGLVLTVEESAGILTWNVAAGGAWTTDNAWLMDGEEMTFQADDAVIFDTLAEASDPVVVTIADTVSVGAITVQGDTSYTLDGNITGSTEGDLGLVVGTADAPFTGTLTLTGSNTWTGANTINSGTVVAAHAGALSSSATTVKSGAELQLNIAGGALSSTLALESGSCLTALESGAATGSAGDAKLQAAAGKTLTFTPTGSLGRLTINSTGKAGEVKLAGGAATSVAAVDVQVGSLTLSKQGASAAFAIDAVNSLAHTTLSVESGVSLTGKLGTKGDLNLASGSELQITGVGSAAKIDSDGAILSGSGYAAVDELALSGSATVQGGEWDIAAASGSGALNVASAADVTLRQGHLTSARLSGGELKAGDGLAVDALALTGGSLSGADSNAATVSVDALDVSGTAQVDSKVTLELGGSGTISGGSVAGRINIADGASLTISGGSVTGAIALAGAGSSLDLSGLAASMDLSMVGGGTLANAAAYTGTLTLDDQGNTPGVAFELGGMGSAAKLTIVSIHGGNAISGAEALTLTGKSTLYINQNIQEETGSAIFNFSGSGALALDSGATLLVDVSAVLADVIASGQAGMSYRISNKSIEDWDAALTLDATAVVLRWGVEYYENGLLHFLAADTANERNIYQSTEQQGGSNNWAESENDRDIYESVGSWGAIVVDKETNIDLSGTTPTGIYKNTGLLLHNLMGTNEGNLNIRGDGSSKVTLQNDVSESELDAFRGQLGSNGGLVQNSLTYGGNINIDGADLEVKHVDGIFSSTPSIHSTTAVAGDLKLTRGNLIMTSGRLELRGQGNELSRDVTFNAYQGQLSISGCASVSGVISVQDDPSLEGEERAHVQLTDGGELILAGGAAAGQGVIIGSDELSNSAQLAGTLTIGTHEFSRATTISANAALRHVVLQVNGTLEVDSTASFAARSAADAEWRLAGLSGQGALSADGKDISFIVSGQDRYFCGSLEDYAGTMNILASRYTQHFNGVAGNSGWNVSNETGGRVSFNLADGGKGNSLTMGNLDLQAGSFTSILLDFENLGEASGLHMNRLTIADKADVTLGQYAGTVWLDGEDGDVFVFALGSLDAKESSIGKEVQWHLKGIRNAGDFSVGTDEDGNLVVTVTQDNTNLYAQYADNANSAAGAKILWGKNTGVHLAMVDAMLYTMLSADSPSQADVAEANRVLAAVAGSSTAVLNQAFSADMERQLRNIRNRTATMAPASSAFDPEDPPVNAWIQAENSYYKQDADGMMPGFKTVGWGGTVGMDMTSGSDTVFGLALSAMYNDVDSDGADTLKGHMDTLYVSAFAQVTDGAWKHTFVSAFGMADIEANRTVNYGLGQYKTQGDTSARGFGLMYELGYSVALNEEATTCLQTVFNAAWRMSWVDAYDETGSDAALRVDGQTYSSLTLGFGARMQTLIGSELWNSSGVLETRALVKTALGDRAGEASVSFKNAASRSATVKSAEKGSVGIELGAGLTLPTHSTGSFFADFSVELWQNLVEMNTGVGYRVSF